MKEMLKYKEIGYILDKPENFDENSKYPVIIMIHGAGSRGNDLNMLLGNPSFQFTDEYNLPVVRIAPQCYADTWFDIFEQLQEFVKYCVDLPYIDEDRVYIMGASMGGYATWQMAMAHPDWFAAVVPICGGGMYWNAHRLKNSNVWAFHGADDGVVLCRESEIMVKKINENGGNAKLTIFENVQHDSWNNVYGNREFFDWLLSCKRGEISDVGKGEYENAELFG